MRFAVQPPCNALTVLSGGPCRKLLPSGLMGQENQRQLIRSEGFRALWARHDERPRQPGLHACHIASTTPWSCAINNFGTPPKRGPRPHRVPRRSRQPHHRLRSRRACRRRKPRLCSHRSIPLSSPRRLPPGGRRLLITSPHVNAWLLVANLCAWLSLRRWCVSETPRRLRSGWSSLRSISSRRGTRRGTDRRHSPAGWREQAADLCLLR